MCQVKQFTQFAENFFITTLAYAIYHTGLQVAVQQRAFDLVYSSSHSIRLLEDVNTILVFLHHLAYAFEMAFNIG